MTSANEILTDDAKLLGWLSNNGIRVVTSFGIDVEHGRSGPIRFSCQNIELSKLKAALAALVKPYQEHIDADHVALKRVTDLHHSDRDYCPEDGFTQPCRTLRAVIGMEDAHLTSPEGPDDGGFLPDEKLIDPDCRDGKCTSCVGGLCEHECHA